MNSASNPKIVLHFWPEYSRESPFWSQDERLPTKGAIELEHLPALKKDTADALRNWCAEWHSLEIHPADRPMPDRATLQRGFLNHRRKAEKLVSHVQKELGDKYQVVLGEWEMLQDPAQADDVKKPE